MWKSIDTAPKDNTLIIVRGGKIKEFDGTWWDLEDYDIRVVYYNTLKSCFVTQILTEEIRPTHWIEFPND